MWDLVKNLDLFGSAALKFIGYKQTDKLKMYNALDSKINYFTDVLVIIVGFPR